MNWKTILAMLTGPLLNALRGGVLAACTWAATKYGIDGETQAAVVAGVMAVATWLLNATIASASVTKEAAAQLSDVRSVHLVNGQSIIR